MVRLSYYDEIVLLALLYNYEATFKKNLLCEKVNSYVATINDKLQKLNSNYFCVYYQKDVKTVYEAYQSDDGQYFFKLKDDINPYMLRNETIKLLPLDLVVISQSDEALIQIDLCLENGKIKEMNKENTSKLLIKK